MKVLYVADQYKTGGAADALIELVKLAKKNGLDVLVVTGHNNEMGERLFAEGIEYVYCGYNQFSMAKPASMKWRLIRTLLKPYYLFRYRSTNKKALQIASENIDFNEIDIIHSNVNRVDFGAILSKKYNKPHVWHLRECPSGHFELSFLCSYPNGYMNENAMKFVAISRFVKDEWVKFGLDEDKIDVIYDGVDLSEIDEKTDSGNGDGFKIACIGQITPQKGQELIIDAFNEMDDINVPVTVDFWGSGDSEYVEKLKKKVYLKKNISVNFLGFDPAVKNKLKDYDIGINSSTNEGFGRTTVEYMAAGLCTLVLNNGGNKELVVNGKNGLCFNDKNELKRIITMLINRPEMIGEIAKNGRTWALNTMDMNNNIQSFIDFYKRCIYESVHNWI